MGDCPTGTVTVSPPVAPTVMRGTTVSGKGTVTVHRAGFTAKNGKSPGRCTAILTATGPMTDPDASNNTTSLVIDVIDRKDF